MPAKPGKAKDLIEADDIRRKAVADFIDSLLVLKRTSDSLNEGLPIKMTREKFQRK